MAIPDFKEQQRILRSLEIAVIRRSDTRFEAFNGKNGHKYVLLWEGGRITCQCPDSHQTDHCKHVYAVERAIEVFNDAEAD